MHSQVPESSLHEQLEGLQPGAELLAAVEAAKEAGLKVELVDRDIQTTLRRAWNKMSFKEKFGLMWALLAEEETDEELELEQMLADKDLLTSLMEAADRVDSTCGIQMAYVKTWAPRSHNDLELRVPTLLPRPGRGACRAHRLGLGSPAHLIVGRGPALGGPSLPRRAESKVWPTG